MAEVAFCRHEWDFERKYDEGFFESGNSVNRAGYFSSFITLFVCVKLSHPRMADAVLVRKSLLDLFF
jgi:hypothetical protein